MTAKSKKFLKLDGTGTFHEEVRPTKDKENQLEIFSLSLARDIGFAIAVPLTGGALLGVWLDSRFNTKLKLTLAFLVLGLILSVASFYKIIADILKEGKK